MIDWNRASLGFGFVIDIYGLRVVSLQAVCPVPLQGVVQRDQVLFAVSRLKSRWSPPLVGVTPATPIAERIPSTGGVQLPFASLASLRLPRKAGRSS
jgi:hypothetical protein